MMNYRNIKITKPLDNAKQILVTINDMHDEVLN